MSLSPNGVEIDESVPPRQESLFRPQWMPIGFDESKLPQEEKNLLAILKLHVGKARAIKVSFLSHFSAIGERGVREMLKHFTEEHGLGIATSIGEPYGVYLIETAEELDEYCANLQARGLSVLRRAAVLKKTHLPALLGQLAMEQR